MGIVYKNNAKTTLASNVSNSATSLSVADGSVFPDPGAGEFFLVTLDDGSNNEIVKCTARSSNTLTVVRAQESTTARAFNAGDAAEGRVTAGFVTSIQENIAAKSANQTVYNATAASSATDYDIGVDPGVEANAMVFLDGVMQHHDTFSFSGSTLTFDAAPTNGTKIEVIVDNLINLQSSNLTVDTFTATSNQTAFTLSDSPGGETNVLAFIDGVFQNQSSYSLSSNTLTFDTGVVVGRTVTVYTINPVNIGTPSDGTVSSAKLTGNITLPGSLTVGSNNVAFDSPTFVVDHANSRVGLGTATPSVPVDIVGEAKVSSHLSLPDNAKIKVGTGGDLEVYHNGTHSFIDNNKGALYIRNNVDDDDNNNIIIQAKSGEHSIICNDDGAVVLYHDDSPVAETAAGGFSTSTGMNLIVGASASLSMNGTVVIDPSRNLTNIGTISSGAITSTGDFLIDAPSGNPSITIKTAGTGNNPVINYRAGNNTIFDNAGIFSAATDYWRVGFGNSGTVTTEVLSVTTESRVGINTVLPAYALDVRNGIVFAGRAVSDDGNISYTNTAAALSSRGVAHTDSRSNVLRLLRDGTSGVVYAGVADFDLSRWESVGVNSRTAMTIKLGHGDLNSSQTTDVMTLRSDGNVGIGVAAPNNALVVNGSVESRIDGNNEGGQFIIRAKSGVSNAKRYSMDSDSSGFFRIIVEDDADTGGGHGASGFVSVYINPNGIMYKPKNPYFLAVRSGNLTSHNMGAVSSAATLIYNSTVSGESSSTGLAAFSTTTGQFTAPVSGMYMFSYSAYSDTSIEQAWLINSSGNRINYTDMVLNDSGTTGGSIFSCNMQIYLAAGTAVSPHFYSAGSTNTTIIANAYHTYWKGVFLG